MDERWRAPPSPTHSQCHASGQALPPGRAKAGWFQPKRAARALRKWSPGEPNVTVPPTSEKSDAFPHPCIDVPFAAPEGLVTTGAAHALLPCAVTRRLAATCPAKG